MKIDLNYTVMKIISCALSSAFVVLLLIVSCMASKGDPQWVFDVNMDGSNVSFYVDEVPSDGYVLWMIESDVQKALLEMGSGNEYDLADLIKFNQNHAIIDPDDPAIRFIFRVLSNVDNELNLVIKSAMIETYSRIMHDIYEYKDAYGLISVFLRKINSGEIDPEESVYSLKKGTARMDVDNYQHFFANNFFFINIYFRKFVSMEIDDIRHPAILANVRTRGISISKEESSNHTRLLVYIDEEWMVFK